MTTKLRTREVNEKWWVVLNEHFIVSGPYDDERDALAYIDEMREDSDQADASRWRNPWVVH